MTHDVHARLETIFRDTLQEDVALRDEFTAADVDGWDSLAHVSIIYAVEDEFRIQLSQDEMVNIANIGDLKACIEQKLAR